MKVKRPVFIIGLGRSGSTIFFDILSKHPDMIWLSKRICNTYPNKPELNRVLMNYINYPVVGELLRRYYEPGECYPYWNTLYRGFGGSYRDLRALDVTDRAKCRIKSSLGRMLKKPNSRFLIKITGWNRMRFLREIFPDALFIHVQRDPRAVINSLLNVYFWPGWNGPQRLLKQQLSNEQKDELELFDNSFVALAGMQIEIFMDAYHDAKATIPTEQLMEVGYESLCDDPLLVYKEVCSFCNMRWINRFENEVKNSRLRNTNYKWQEDLTIDQQKIAQYYFDKLSNKYTI